MKKLSRRFRYSIILTLGIGLVLPFSVLATYLYLVAEGVVPEPGGSAAVSAAPTIAPTVREDISPTTKSSAPTADLFPDTRPMKIGTTPVKASIARTWPERIRGLSGTPYLPSDTVKLFVFESAGFHSIWMKDMKYAIDILWADESGTIVHVVEGATPESYPETFTPNSPAVYVVETVAGFVSQHGIVRGTVLELPPIDTY